MLGREHTGIKDKKVDRRRYKKKAGIEESKENDEWENEDKRSLRTTNVNKRNKQ